MADKTKASGLHDLTTGSASAIAFANGTPVPHDPDVELLIDVTNHITVELLFDRELVIELICKKYDFHTKCILNLISFGFFRFK